MQASRMPVSGFIDHEIFGGEFALRAAGIQTPPDQLGSISVDPADLRRHSSFVPIVLTLT